MPNRTTARPKATAAGRKETGGVFGHARNVAKAATISIATAAPIRMVMGVRVNMSGLLRDCGLGIVRLWLARSVEDFQRSRPYESVTQWCDACATEQPAPPHFADSIQRGHAAVRHADHDAHEPVIAQLCVEADDGPDRNISHAGLPVPFSFFAGL